MRTGFMAYMTSTIEAVDFYCKAFNASSQNCFKASDGDDFYAHAEVIMPGGTVLGLSEASLYDTEFTSGNNMQFWVSFDDAQSITEAYEVLKKQGTVHSPLAPCEWCRLLTDITDKYGVRWMLNVF